MPTARVMWLAVILAGTPDVLSGQYADVSPWHVPTWTQSLPMATDTGLTPHNGIRLVPSTGIEPALQSGGEGHLWGTLLRVAIGAAVGGFLGHHAFEKACGDGACMWERHVVIGTFATLGIAAGVILRPRERAVKWDSTGVDDPLWVELRRHPVPALPPDTLPVWIYALEQVSPPTRYVTHTFIPRIVIVAFHESTPLSVRQQTVDAVNGAVIGGEPASDGEGFYFLLIRDDSSGRGIRDAVKRLTANPSVAAAGPRYVDPP